MSKPAIALYLGETYASAGLFDLAAESKPKLIFEKSAFLPQSSLKALMNQMAAKHREIFGETQNLHVYVVTKYFDRLKLFRLGGSVAQVICKGFENSYCVSDSKSLSLAAAQLIIALEPGDDIMEKLDSELQRIKKINPDLNKVVISLPEDKFGSAQIASVVNFFESAGLKIFRCHHPYDQNELRRTLLNAGCDGTKDEISKDIIENLGPETKVHYFCRDGFEDVFESSELFNSSGNFLARYLKDNGIVESAYFDIESFRFIKQSEKDLWKSPWGDIPMKHFDHADLDIHPYAELRLNQLAMLTFERGGGQLEPGPVVAGRAIKPLLIDLFHDELRSIDFCNNIFTSLSGDSVKMKLNNLFSVMEKGQKTDLLASTTAQLKSVIKACIHDEINFHATTAKVPTIGALAELFGTPKSNVRFSWVQEIAARIPGDEA